MVNSAGSSPGSTLDPRLSQRTDLQVAGALARRPFGARSGRAIARSAGVSPTTAARALRRLQRDGVVVRRVDQVAEGEVRTISVWTIDWRSAAWRRIAAEAGRLHRAGNHADSGPAAGLLPRRARRVPERLAHLFWNADLRAVDTGAHGAYVASRILRADDCQALGWLVRTLHPEAIRAAARGRGLDPRRAALAHLLAGA